jgi:hypothetical protein
MQIIKINDIEYDFDALSSEAKTQLQSMKFVDTELARLNSQIAVLKTARVAYGMALDQALKVPPPSPLAKQLKGDTIKLG